MYALVPGETGIYRYRCIILLKIASIKLKIYMKPSAVWQRTLICQGKQNINFRTTPVKRRWCGLYITSQLFLSQKIYSFEIWRYSRKRNVNKLDVVILFCHSNLLGLNSQLFVSFLISILQFLSTFYKHKPTYCFLNKKFDYSRV